MGGITRHCHGRQTVITPKVMRPLRGRHAHERQASLYFAGGNQGGSHLRGWGCIDQKGFTRQSIVEIHDLFHFYRAVVGLIH
jgi:hypothetical protein